MDWNNVDLNNGYERDQNILDPYSFDTLLLEISCNVKEVTAKTVRQQFETSLQSKINCAREVFEANLANIVAEAIKEKNVK